MSAPADLIGYRALMVSLSDLAAMAALPRYALVALTLPELGSQISTQWVQQLAQGMAMAAAETGTALCGGNLTKGALSISVSVHGEVEQGQAKLRSSGEPGQRLFVTGALGGAAACLRQQQHLSVASDALSAMQDAYFRPQARFDCRCDIQAASCAIDISDGLLQDLNHVLQASGCGADLRAAAIPLGAGATLEDALSGGDDYQILFASAESAAAGVCIGELSSEPGLRIDGKGVEIHGYQHFSA
jgi:thiamine-monophosphate kinase